MSQVVLLAKFPIINENFCNFLHGSPVFFSCLEHPALFDPALIRVVALDDLQRPFQPSPVYDSELFPGYIQDVVQKVEYQYKNNMQILTLKL